LTGLLRKANTAISDVAAKDLWILWVSESCFYTVGWSAWMRNWTVAILLCTKVNTPSEKFLRTSVPGVSFTPTVVVFERQKTVQAFVHVASRTTF
jgi:hypothetical protein